MDTCLMMYITYCQKFNQEIPISQQSPGAMQVTHVAMLTLFMNSCISVIN